MSLLRDRIYWKNKILVIWAFYTQFQVGRERVEYDVPLFHQSCSLYRKSSSWGEKSYVSTTRNVYENKCSLNMNRLVNIGQWCFYLTHCIIHVLFESLWASMKINKFLKALLARYLKNNIVAWSRVTEIDVCVIWFILSWSWSDLILWCFVVGIVTKRRYKYDCCSWLVCFLPLFLLMDFVSSCTFILPR